MSKISVPLKGGIFAAVLALVLASFSTASVFAAGPTTSSPAPSQAISTALPSDWKTDLSALQFDNTVFTRADRFLDRLDYNKKYDRSETSPAFQMVGAVLGKAESIVKTHAGFDANGQVTDQAQAQKTIAALGSYLSELRGISIYRLLQNL